MSSNDWDGVQVNFGGGTIRINIFPDQTVRVPKLDIELFFFFGRINMYINFVARTDLVRSGLVCSLLRLARCDVLIKERVHPLETSINERKKHCCSCRFWMRIT